MGNDHGSLDERPEHTVTLDEFWIGKTEITVAEFRRFTERSGYPFPAKELVPEENNWLLRGRDGYPMNYVSKQDAQAYATWLSKQSGMRCDLPTEAQWEKAARGIDAAIYPWGDAWDASMANFCDKRCPIQWRKNQDDGFATSSPVDAKPGDRSPWGVLGMGGNVSEWCRDAFGFRYPSSPVKNPLSESKGGGNSIVRGGSWRDFPERLQASYRFHYPEDNRYSHIGFRLVVTE
jgi:formylglycine-generating enzyme required for sulfatase activity